MIRSILYATDLGLYASGVLQHALSLSRAYQAELHVVHAVEPLGLFAHSVLQTYLDDHTLAALHERGLSAVMASLEQRVREGFQDELSDSLVAGASICQVRVVQGDPPLVILKEAQRLGVDLLVIGSHSDGSAFDTPLGRTAARLVQLSEVPVYLVPMLQHRCL